MNFDLESYLMHHVTNSDEWHIPFLPTIELPAFLTLHGLMLFICAAFLVFVFCFVYNKKTKVPSGITNFLEVIVLFIRDEMVVPFLGKEDGKKMTPLFCTLFFFILTLNLMGLIPLFSTATSNINVTGALAVVTFMFMFFGCIYKNGIVGFLKLFMPSGVPVPILFILAPIEFIGLFIKPFALMIRLFANMLAGHIIIICLLGIVVLLGIFALPAVLLALFIYLLEILVAFLQAFIFTFLSAIFIGQTMHPAH